MPGLRVTCRDAGNVDRHYLPALRAAGWTGVVHKVAVGDAKKDAANYDGLLLTGGADIHPRFWDPREPVHPAADPDEDRDLMERALILGAWAARIPILGICRGIQILNVALGGSLVQDIPDTFGCPPARHKQGSAGEPAVSHRVAVDPAARLAGWLGGTDIPVNSRHHQALRTVSPHLRAVAWAPDTDAGGLRLIEGAEAVDPNRWVCAVQWHPENLVGLEDPAGVAARMLFRAFVQALAHRAHGATGQVNDPNL